MTRTIRASKSWVYFDGEDVTMEFQNRAGATVAIVKIGVGDFWDFARSAGAGFKSHIKWATECSNRVASSFHEGARP